MYLPLALSNMRDLRRLAVAHTPMTAFLLSGFFGTLPSRVSCLIGISSAMVCTLYDCTELTPFMFGIEIRWASFNGRSAPRSKMLPRSTWNASARWPQKTLMPCLTPCTAWAESLA